MILSRKGAKMKSRFGLILGIFIGVVLLTYREEVLGTLLGPITALTANTTFFLLDLIMMDVVQEASIIYHPGGFAYEIYYRCTGFLPVACLTVFILAYPGNFQHKLVGLAIGIPLLILLNLVRLVNLFIIGVVWPNYFDFAHDVLWNSIVILVVLGFWLIWKNWAHPPIVHGDRFSRTELTGLRNGFRFPK